MTTREKPCPSCKRDFVIVERRRVPKDEIAHIAQYNPRNRAITREELKLDDRAVIYARMPQHGLATLLYIRIVDITPERITGVIDEVSRGIPLFKGQAVQLGPRHIIALFREPLFVPLPGGGFELRSQIAA